MKITKALKMRIYPNKEQALKIDKTIGSCRYVYNHMLARNKKVYERRNEHLSYYDMQNLLLQTQALFAGGDVPQADKDKFFQAVMEAYVATKEDARERFTNKRYKK